MQYIESNNIDIFPLAKNRPIPDKRSNNLFYERNISNIVNQIIDVPGFVITHDTSNIQVSGNIVQLTQGTFEFSLGGRYFHISVSFDNSNPVPTILCTGVGAGGSVWAYVEFDQYGEIQGQDQDNIYSGLHITTNEEEIPSDSVKLKLFNIVQGKDNILEVVIPSDSYKKFDINSIAPTIKFIDGKR